MIIRGRIFYLRIKVPSRLQQQIGRTHVWRSLRTGNTIEAVRRSRLIAAEVEAMLLAADGIVVALPSVGSGSAILPTAPSASNTGGTPRQPEKTLRRLFDLFTNDPAKNRARRIQLAHESLFALVGNSGAWTLASAPLIGKPAVSF
jgi:hypothetical protein